MRNRVAGVPAGMAHCLLFFALKRNGSLLLKCTAEPEEQRGSGMDQGYYRSIRKNILLSMILVPVIPFILSLAIGYSYFVNALETNTIASMKRIVADHRQMIESFLRERSDDLMFILNEYGYQDLSRAEILEGVFRNLQSRSPAFVDLGVFDQSGSHVAYQGPYSLDRKSTRLNSSHYS